MKKYRLLKDLPLAKAESIFTKVNYDMCQNDGKYDISLEFFGDKFDEWFEEVEEKPWEPKIHELYYYISGSGNVCSDMNTESSIDHDFITIGDCFKTREEAEKAVEKLKALKRLRDKGLAFGDWRYIDDIDGEDKVEIRIRAVLDYDAILDQSAREDLGLLFEEGI